VKVYIVLHILCTEHIVIGPKLVDLIVREIVDSHSRAIRYVPPVNQ
jgi:hypothetical protein